MGPIRDDTAAAARAERSGGAAENRACTPHNAFGIGDNQDSRYQCVTLFAVLLSRSAGGFFCGGATLVKRDELMLYGCWNRGKTLREKKAGKRRKRRRRGGLRGRMFHFALQACATVDEKGGEDVGSE